MEGDRGDLQSGASRLIRRQRMLLIIAGLAATISTAGLAASTFVRSPAERAADQAAPPATLLTAPVLKEVLKTTVVVRGTVIAASSIDVNLPASSTGVVSALPKKVGDAVTAGQVVLQVSGRPVIALPGSVPAYRDLKPGQTGPDVGQLRAALAGLGYADADAAGAYGAGTKQAVAALYNHLGYDPVKVGDDNGTSDSVLQSAQDAVTQAQRKVDSDTAGLAGAQGAPAIAAAQQELGYSKQDLATARSRLADVVATTGVEFPQTEIVFVPFSPAVIGAVNVKVGSSVSATPLLSIDSTTFVVSSVVPAGQQQLIKPGLSVKVNDDASANSSVGVVTSLGSFTSGTSTASAASSSAAPASSGYPLLVTPTAALPFTWLGVDVRLTITAASTASAVLVVPIAAITSSADGDTLVTVITADGSRRRVNVAVGANANGMVEVTPTDATMLAEGDLVVTGQ